MRAPTNGAYEYFLRSWPIDWNDPLVLRLVEDYKRIHDGVFPAIHDINHQLWQLLGFDATKKPTYEETIKDWTDRLKPPPPTGDLTPLIQGNWRGNFLYPYFGAAVAAYDDDRRDRYFAQLKARGDLHVLINAQQVDWGGERWTGGSTGPYADRIGGEAYSFNANKSRDAMTHLVSVCTKARYYGLTPCVGLIEQRTLKTFPFLDCVEMSLDTVDAVKDHTTLLDLTWEADEVWGNGDEREPKIRQWIETLNRRIDPSRVDIGIHYADGMRGGNNFYGSLPDNACRLMQYWNDADEAALRQSSRLVAEVAANTGTSVCAFEHSSPYNQSPNRSEEEASRRAQACLEEMSKFVEPYRTGSFNGF